MERNIYQEYGFENRAEYLKGLAEDYEVEYEDVVMIASMLGPNEDFDGLISSLEDFVEMYGGSFE